MTTSMALTLDWLHIIALLGAAQGVFLAGVLATQRRNRRANRILAVAMLAFSVYLATSAGDAAGLMEVFPHLFGAAYPMPLLFGPLIYLYATTASDRSRRLTRWDALHFAPFVVLLVAALPIYLSAGAEKIALYHALQSGWRLPITRVFDPLKLLSGVTYTVVTVLVLRRHRAAIEDNYSSLEHVTLRWLLRLAVAGGVIWVLAVGFELTQFLDNAAFRRGDDVITLAIALLVYGIGYMALRQPEIFRYVTAEHRVVAPEGAAASGGPAPAAGAIAAATEAGSGGSRYERSGLGEREAESLKASLLETMERDRPWQDTGLTLADLARRLSTTPHKLSEVLNSQLSQSFYDFVNGYRVRYVQGRIGSEEARNLTILSLALDAGFASKSTFNDVFKKHTGKTPSEFRRPLVE